MDSLTQIVLGAGIGELTMGRKIGNRAQLIGAIGGTLPDLDVLFTLHLKNSVEYFEIHRSYSHALFPLILAAFPLAYLTHIIFKRKHSYWAFYTLWALALVTHTMLDCCTTYGTQFFLPFSRYLVGLNTISIIDPLYTIPFMVLLIICLFKRRESPIRRKIAIASFIVSTTYMVMVIGCKLAAYTAMSFALKNNHVVYSTLSTTPSIFNGMLWAGIAYNRDSLHVGEYSVWDKDKNVDFVSFPTNQHLKEKFACPELSTLMWFSQGQYIFEHVNDTTARLYLVKWGRFDYDKKQPLDAFRFYFTLIKHGDNKVDVISHEPSEGEINFKEAFAKLWRRIFYY